METLIKRWDGEEVIIRYDHPTDAWIFVAVHSTRLGPAGGGTRMMTYPDTRSALQDAMNLAEQMTLKWAVSNMPYGGGKTVIVVPPHLDPQARLGLLRRYASLVHQLGGLFLTGPDVGTSPTDVDVMAETAGPYVFGRSSTAGGTGLCTAYGVFAGIQVTCEHLFGTASLVGKQVLVQGAGGVGGPLIDLLRRAGAEVMFSEVDDVIIQRHRDEIKMPFVPADEVFDTPCDIFAPCALGGVLNEETIPRLQCRAVVGAANNQLASPNDAVRLQERGILYAPDFVVNFGGAMGITGIEGLGWSHDEAKERIVLSLQGNLLWVYELAEQENLTTDAAARRLAGIRLAERIGEKT